MSHPEGAAKEGVFIAVSASPDVCKTPPNNVPIPYRVVAKLDEGLSVSPNVFFRGHPVVLADGSSIANVTGDESGSGGGVSSGCNEGEVKFIEGDDTFLVNGKRVVRDKDEVTMNKGNTKGKVQCLMSAAPASAVDADGKPPKPANPMVKRQSIVPDSTEPGDAGGGADGD
jgi:hypothetical protein